VRLAFKSVELQSARTGDPPKNFRVAFSFRQRNFRLNRIQVCRCGPQFSCWLHCCDVVETLYREDFMRRTPPCYVCLIRKGGATLQTTRQQRRHDNEVSARLVLIKSRITLYIRAGNQEQIRTWLKMSVKFTKHWQFVIERWRHPSDVHVLICSGMLALRTLWFYEVSWLNCRNGFGFGLFIFYDGLSWSVKWCVCWSALVTVHSMQSATNKLV